MRASGSHVSPYAHSEQLPVILKCMHFLFIFHIDIRGFLYLKGDNTRMCGICRDEQPLPSGDPLENTFYQSGSQAAAINDLKQAMSTSYTASNGYGAAVTYQ